MGASLSPTKPSTLPRSPSSPSLAHAVGLPPPIPDSGLMPPATPTRSRASLKPTRDPATPSRRGEVESPTPGDGEGGMQLEVPRVKAKASAPPSPSPATPKRKVVNSIEGATPRSAAKKRDNLQNRLSAITAGSPRKPRPSSSTLTANARAAPPTPGSEARNSDKVVVCMRIKPTKSDFIEKAYELSPTSLSLSDAHPNVQRRGGKAGREAEYTYTFDTLVQHPTRTPELYEDKIAPLVHKAMNGFNSTVFAYGQTGSGKSHTMSGTPQELGIIPCAVDGIFDAITADTERAFLLRVSYLEIYNEAIRDLLNSKKGPLPDDEKPSIHTGKGKITVDPLVEEIVSTPKDVVDLLDRGNTNRKTGATDWNERSSRSHAVFTIVIESRPRESEGEDEIRVSKLTLIDLAGSEKAVSDVERRGEGKHINQSLLALREVVHKLTEKGKRGHVPYRNSKLTHLLENVLGGDSNICVICTMSADEQHCSETLETLKFAGRCSQVETKAQKNILLSSDRAVIRAKDLEIAELRKQLETMGGRQTIPEAPEEMAELQDTLADMEARKAKLISHLAKLNGEILTSELPRSGIGLPISTPRMKRPRISDFTSLASGLGGLGLGTPTPKKAFDRRAVSNMVRVPEEMTPVSSQDTMIGNLDPSMKFDSDIQLAALRRTISVKEAALSEQAVALATAKEDAEQLPSVQAELNRLKEEMVTAESLHASKLQDAHDELEKTRTELAQSLAENAKRVESLEAAILDLRKSREELVLEDQQRLDKVQSELDKVTSERDTHVKDMNSLRDKHKGEIEKVKDAIRTLRGQADGHASRVTELEASAAQLKTSKEELAASLAAAIKERDDARAEHTSARSVVDSTAKELDELRKTTKDRESEAVAELRELLAKEKAAREGVEARLKESEAAALERTKTLEDGLKTATSKLEASEAQRNKLDEEHKALVVKHDASETKNKELAKSVGEVQGKLAPALEKAATSEASLKKANEELATAKTQLAEVQSGSEATTAKVAALEAEKAKLEEQATTAQEKVDAAEKKATEADTAAKVREEALSKEVGELKIEAAKYFATATESEEQLKSTKSELEEKAGKLSALEVALVEAKKQHEAALAEANKEHNATKTSLAEESKQHDVTKTSLAEASKQHDATKATLAEANKQHDVTKTSLAEANKQHDATKTALDDAKSRLATTKTALDDTTKQLATTKTALQEKTTAHDDATKEVTALRAGASVADSVKAELEAKKAALETLTTEKAQIAKQLEEALARIAALEKELADLKALFGKEQTSHGDVKTSLDKELAAHSDTKASLDKEKAAMKEAKASLDKQRAAHAEIKAALEKERSTHKDTKAALEKARTSSDASLAEVQAAADALRASLAKEEAAHVEAKAKLESLEPKVSSLEAELAAARKARDGSASELEKLVARTKELEGKLTAAEKAHSGSKDEHSKKLEAALAAAAALEQQLQKAKDSHTATTADMEKKLRAAEDTHSTQAADLAKKLEAAEASFKAAQDKHTAELAALRSEADGHKEARALLDQQEREHEETRRALANEKKAREDLAAAISAAKAGVASLDKELDLSRSELAAARARNDRLAAEIVTLSTALPETPATRRALASTTSVPNALSSVAGDALRGKGDMSSRAPDVEGWKKSHELEEIDQLDKVVEAQKSVIAEQRQKIQFWAEELDKQREVVRLLTQDGSSSNSNIASPAGMSTPRRHMRSSMSMSSVPSPGSPSTSKGLELSPAPPGYASSRARGHISSSFTAKNLALPSAPSPLPMHDRQQHILRKARRITIEHDIDRLQERSKVNRLKSVFDSPEKEREKEEIPPPRVSGMGSRRAQVEIARRR